MRIDEIKLFGIGPVAVSWDGGTDLRVWLDKRLPAFEKGAGNSNTTIYILKTLNKGW